MTMNRNKTIIIDSGTGLIKAGFAEEEFPSIIIPTVVGYPKNKSENTEGKECYAGEQALLNYENLDIKFPIEYGIINDWTGMECIWKLIFEKLKVNPSESNVFLTEKPLTPKDNRLKMAEIMFGKFKVPNLYIGDHSILPLYAYKRTTGCVVDIGDNVAHIVPIYQGKGIMRAVARLDIGGRNIAQYAQKLLNERGFSFNSPPEQEI